MPPDMRLEEDEVVLTENEIKVAKTSLDLMVGMLYSFAKDPTTRDEACKMIVTFEEECELGPEDEGWVATAIGASDKLSELIGEFE